MPWVTIQGLAVGLTVVGAVWAVVLAAVDPSRAVLAALAVASIGFLTLTATASRGQDDDDGGPPTADDLER
jgi:hypothetical protein